MRRSDVLIVGTGAMGNLFGARLAATGSSVSMLGTWPDGLAALQQNGIQFENPSGDFISYPVRATDNPQECAGVKLALVLVKAWQTERVARQLAECLAPDGFALSLQNGLGNREILTKYLGDQRGGAGVTTTGATLLPRADHLNI